MDCKFPDPCWYQTHVQHVTKNMTTPVYLDSTRSTDSHGGESFLTLLGGASIRTGLAILLVPDPIPVVDEVVAVSLIGFGALMYALDRS